MSDTTAVAVSLLFRRVLWGRYARVRAFDWQSILLGAPAQWPQSLQIAVSTCVKLFISDLDLVRTRPHQDLQRCAPPDPGGRHPSALGQPGRTVWREIWDDANVLNKLPKSPSFRGNPHERPVTKLPELSPGARFPLSS
jgi:hypothetical protein